MCKYKVIMREPLGLSTKPGCADGRKAQLAGPQAVIAHVAAQIRAATAEAARER
jgi:hypothetical protein